MKVNLKPKNLTIYYANVLARMNTKFTLEEEKALHLIFSKINAFGKNDTTIKLNKLDFFDKLELESSNRYNRYRKLIRGLIHKTYIEFINEKGTEFLGVVINSSSGNPKEPTFEVELTKMFMPYLEQLIRDYTKVDLSSIVGFKSKYTLTIYKFLCSWTDEKKLVNQRYLTTKELKELLGLSIDDYVYNGKFKRYEFERETINVAMKEINEKTNFNVSFKKNKQNNRVQHYEFTGTQKEKSISSKNQKKQLTIFDAENKELKAECSIVHKNMYEENDCKKIHGFKGNENGKGINFFADDNEIVGD